MASEAPPTLTPLPEEFVEAIRASPPRKDELAGEQFVFRHGKLRGAPVCPGVDKSSYALLMRSFEHKDGDVVVASYGRSSGGPWVSRILQCLFHASAEESAREATSSNNRVNSRRGSNSVRSSSAAGACASPRKGLSLGASLPVLEVYVARTKQAGIDSLASWKPACGRRVFKSHLSSHLCPCLFSEAKTKSVVVVRDPGTLMIDLYHLYRNDPVYQYEGSWNHFFSLFLEGKHLPGGDWFDFTAGWLEMAQTEGPDSVCIINYEDMLSDLKGVVCKLAAFFEAPCDSGLVRRICSVCSSSVCSSSVLTASGSFEVNLLMRDDESEQEALQRAAAQTGPIGSVRLSPEQTRKLQDKCQSSCGQRTILTDYFPQLPQGGLLEGVARVVLTPTRSPRSTRSTRSPRSPRSPRLSLSRAPCSPSGIMKSPRWVGHPRQDTGAEGVMTEDGEGVEETMTMSMSVGACSTATTSPVESSPRAVITEGDMFGEEDDEEEKGVRSLGDTLAWSGYDDDEEDDEDQDFDVSQAKTWLAGAKRPPSQARRRRRREEDGPLSKAGA